MGNEDLYKSALADYLYYCIANLNKESQKPVVNSNFTLSSAITPKDGKTKRRERRKQQLKRRKGRL